MNDLTWMQGQEAGPGSGLNVRTVDYGHALDIAVVGKRGKCVLVRISRSDPLDMVAKRLRFLADRIDNGFVSETQ